MTFDERRQLRRAIDQARRRPPARIGDGYCWAEDCAQPIRAGGRVEARYCSERCQRRQYKRDRRRAGLAA